MDHTNITHQRMLCAMFLRHQSKFTQLAVSSLAIVETTSLQSCELHRNAAQAALLVINNQRRFERCSWLIGQFARRAAQLIEAVSR